MFAIDYSVIIQIANFLLLLFLLNIFLYRPIRGILRKRKDEIASDEKMREDWKQRADTSERELEKKISETKKEGLIEKESLKNDGIEGERDMLQEAHSLAETKLERTRDEVKEKLVKVRESLRAELEGFSQELAEKILGRGI